ncbi:uncharacterized protein [Nicotiana tomentosiformis]|uniref:uncharacterized protein n=1 Tax=Nicotiana tomentosiformis TaxID=4098 RepID=UPI00388C6D45
MSSIDEDKDRGWMGRYIRVRTRDLIPEEKMSFPEKWNFDRVTRDAVLRPSSGDEGNKSPVLEQGKENKRRASSRPEDPKPKTRKAIGRFRVDLSQCEAELRKVLGERDDLRLLCSKKEEPIKDLQADLAKLQQKIEKIGLLREEVDQIRAECNQWKETIDRLAAEKETILTKLLSADVQLRNVKQKVSVQAKKIDELEIRLAEAKAEVESLKVLADKSIAVYRADAEAAQVEAREAAKITDARDHWVAELVKCRSRRETLEEIHARGFDLTEKVRKAKELEAEAEALASDDDDDDNDDGSKSRSEGEKDPDPEA